MRIIIPPITRPISLTDYAPELAREDGAPVVVHVWVNPPARMIDEYRHLLATAQTLRQQLETPQTEEELKVLGGQLVAIGERFSEWYADIWSKHADAGTHWTTQDVRDLATSETDPDLHNWLRSRTWDLITAHRTGEKKA